MKPVEQFEVNGLIVKIFQHDTCDSPRKEWDNMGTLACFHSNYDLGDKTDVTREQIQAWLDGDYDGVIMPVYLMDHSGLSISVKNFSCPWDSGCVGAIFVSAEKIAKEYGDDGPEQRERAKQCLRREIETLDQYLQGDVYGYTVERPRACGTCQHVELDHVDSCWGFYGLSYCTNEAKASAEALSAEVES